MKTEKFASGSYIFKEGDLSQEAYRIIKGKVELTTDCLLYTSDAADE